MSSQAKYFLYFMYQKGDKLKEETAFKVRVSNNVKSDRLMFEEGKNADLKTYKVVKTRNGDAAVLMEEFRVKYKDRHVSRNWYTLTKAELDEVLANFGSREGCQQVSESKAMRAPEKPKEKSKAHTSKEPVKPVETTPLTTTPQEKKE